MDPALERRIQVLMVGLDKSMRLVKSELLHLIAGESEGGPKPHNQVQSPLNNITADGSENTTNPDPLNGFDGLKTHTLDKDGISTLYEYHKPPGFTLKQFDQFVHSLPYEDVRDLFDAIPKEEVGFKRRSFSLDRLVRNNVSRKALGDKLWDEYGPSFGLDKSEFFAVVNLAAPQDLAELVIAMENDHLDEPVRKRAKILSKSPVLLQTSLTSRLSVSEVAREVPEIASQNTNIPSSAKASSSLQPHFETSVVDMAQKRRRSVSLNEEIRNFNQLEDAISPLPKSSSTSDVALKLDTRAGDDLQGQLSRKKRKRAKKKSNQHTDPPIQVINHPIPVVRIIEGDQEATSKAIRRRKKKERRRERRRRHDKEQVKTASNTETQGNVKAADALKSVQFLDDRLAEQSISSSTLTQSHPTRYLSPELGDVLTAGQIPSTMEVLTVDYHDSAYEESSVEDGNGGLLQGINQTRAPEKTAASNRYALRMSTPPLLTFDQETGEMLCIPESPFCPSAMEVSDSEMSDEEGGVEISHKSQSPLKALMNRVNKMFRPDGPVFEEPDVNGSEASEPEHMEVDPGQSVCEKPRLDDIRPEKTSLPKYHSMVRLVDVVKAEGLREAESDSDNSLIGNLEAPEPGEAEQNEVNNEDSEPEDLNSGLSAQPSLRFDPMIKPNSGDQDVRTYNDLEDMVLDDDASISALESSPITYVNDQPNRNSPTDNRQINVHNIDVRSDNQHVSVLDDESIKSPSTKFSKSRLIGPGQFDNQPALDLQDSSSATSQGRKKIEIRYPAGPSEVHPEAEKLTQNSPNRETGSQSQYFQSPIVSPNKSKRLPAGTSCIPFPPLSAESFGLIQEKVAHDPFKLLVAVTLLNKTKGTVAIPMFHAVIQRYPTATDLVHANISDLAAMIKNLGLQNTRANTLVNLAKTWIEEPPVKGKRYRTLNYPVPGAGRDIRPSEVLDDDDERQGAFEIGHLPGCGSYAMDSWRIFCRDRLRGLASGYNGDGANETFQPEWTRVVPKDKELRAFLRWSWLREGFAWNPLTGEKEVASARLRDQAEHGHMSWNDPGPDNVKPGSPIHKATLSQTDHVDSSPQIDATVGASLETKRSLEASDRGSLELDGDSNRHGVITTKLPAAPIEQNDPGILSHPEEEEGPITKLLKLSERRTTRAKKGKIPGKRRSKRLSGTDGVDSIEG
jgi:methyl-CpG-binding domain protein 4